jgi:hypothetical protein
VPWMSVCCECCVLSGRGLCDGLITRTEESYRVRCMWLSVNVVTSILKKLTPKRDVEPGLEKRFVIHYTNAMPNAMHYPKYIYSQGVSWLAVVTSSGNYLELWHVNYCVLRILTLVEITRRLWLGYQQYYSYYPGLKPNYDINICLIYPTLFIYYKLIHLKSTSTDT